MSSVRDPAPPAVLAVKLEATAPESHVYRLTLQNLSDLVLVDGEIDLEVLVGPDSFGLDDTHMPPRQPDVQRFDRLMPGESILSQIEGWGTPGRYEGPTGGMVRASYGAEGEAGGTRRSEWVKIDAPGLSLRRPRVSSHVPRGALWRQLRPVLLLAAFGAVVLLLAARKGAGT